MSQAGVLSGNGGGGGGTLSTLTGNTGGAVSPDGAANINLLGAGTLTVTGNPGTNTLTISQSGTVATSYVTASGTAVPSAGILNILGSSGITTSGAGNTVTITGIQSTTSQIGVVTLATNAQAIAGTDANNAVTSAALAAKLGTQTIHTVSLFEGSTSALSASNAGTNGQLFIGATGADPAFATLTSSDSSISFTTGANSLSLQVNGGTTVGKTITGNSGGALSPTAGNWNIVGTGSITSSGAGSTLTTQLTGLTNHSLLVGAGTATITNLGVATNGQIPIGSTGADPTLGTLTAGANITITNGAGTITIAASGAITWADQTGSFTPAATHGYFITGTSTATLPAAPSAGDTIYFILDTTNILTITANTGQFIRLGTTISASAGTCVSNSRGDAITLVYRSTDTTWLALNSVGTWTVT